MRLLLIITIFAFVLGCSQDNQNTNNDIPTDTLNLPDSESFDATIHLYNKDRQTAEIIASHIKKYQVEDSTIAYDLNVNVFDTTRHVTTEISGDSGVIRDETHTIQIYGNVDLITENGTRLETEYLWWDYRTDQIRSDTFVKITRDGSVLTGWKLEADKKLNSIKILERVSGEIKDFETVSP